MKTPAQRFGPVVLLGLGIAAVVLWLAVGRKQTPSSASPAMSPAAAVTASASPAAETAEGVGQQASQRTVAREMADMIQRVLDEGKAQKLPGGEIITLPGDDPLHGYIRLLADRYPARYASLFQQLGLNAEEVRLMTNLMIGKQLLLREVTVPLSQTSIQVFVTFENPALGGPGRSGASGNTADLSDVPRREAAAAAPIEAEIKSLLGDNNYALYQNYAQADPLRITVENFQGRLERAGTPPLSESQAAQLLAVMVPEQTPLSGLFRTNQFTDVVVQSSQAFLDPAQQAVLERYHWERKQLDDAIVAAVEAKRREIAGQ
jgi:hypothetical protein